MAYSATTNTQSISFSTPMVTVPPFTVSFFCKYDTASGLATAFRINNSGISQYHYASPGGFAGGTPATVEAVSNVSGTATARTTATHSTTDWFHIVAVWGATNSRTVYLNGGNSVTNTTTKNVTGISEGVILSPNSASGTTLEGAEYGVWDVALTAAEILSLTRFAPRRIRPQNLVFYAPLVRDISDLSGALPLTNNSVVVSEHPRVY